MAIVFKGCDPMQSSVSEILNVQRKGMLMDHKASSLANYRRSLKLQQVTILHLHHLRNFVFNALFITPGWSSQTSMHIVDYVHKNKHIK